jgi:hypothetical protein
MQKAIGFLSWAWWLAGASAAIVAAVFAYGPWWSDQPQVPSSQPRISQSVVKPSGDPSKQVSAGIDHARHLKPGVQAQGLQVLRGDSLALGIDVEALYEALMSFDPSEALQTVARQAETLYALNAIYRRIVELSADDDPQVAERAEYARLQMQALRMAHEIPEPPPPDENEQWPKHAGMTGSQDVLETAVEPFDTVRKRALRAPNPAVRLGGIEAAIRQDDEHGLDLLSQAARGDSEADNRLTAVSELEQMLKNGLGDSDQILALLEETAADPDPRVAELSDLILQEQLDGPQELGHPDEEGASQDGAGMTQPQAVPEQAVEPFATPRERLLVDPDPAVRLGGIQAAASEQPEDGFDLLGEAALGDSEPDNRLSAVSELEQMLVSGVGDRDQILQMLEVTSVDPDPRVTELSQLIIEEQRASTR